MSIDELEQFKCTQCNLLLNDLSISEIETDAGNTVQFTGSSCSPDTLVKSVQINRKLEKSPKSDSQCGTSNDAQQDHTGKQFHTAQQLTNIGALRNNSSPILQFQNTHSDNNSIKQPKQTGPKKQKILKQDDLKSKLAVAEAHIAALENTILDNNNLIRNMKLSQLGQTDYHQNGPDHHSYRQTPSSNNANCSNCHCSQLDNRIRDLEREMSNLRLQHLENQFLTLRQQSQNLVNLQGTPHMNQQGPVHTIHSQHVVQPSPTSVQNHWIQPPVHPLFQQSVPAPPPYMFRQPGRTQLAPSQNIIPNSHMQAQHSQMIYPRAAVATQLSPFDSNNSIAVNPSTHLHSQIHHMSSTQGKVQINTSSNKIVPELITKSYVSNDISNSSIGDSKNSFAVNPSTHLHSQIHHMSSTQGKVQINTSSNKNVPELITKSYVSNDISNSSIGDSKNSFAVRKRNEMKANLNDSSQSYHPRDSAKSYVYPENPDPNTLSNSSNSNSKNCFAVEQRSETRISENCSDTVGLPPNKNVQHIYNPFLDKGQTFLLDPDIAAPVTRMI
ncbi:unnamed protein product [Mytilus edulis]|uniref:Uncharacterized protein n=1 Tax=Mytilus edulis TaxID=6550 RepID=A0A8S3U3U4_MYTED|nr:unnamed protein product [Mytilus edulis]